MRLFDHSLESTIISLLRPRGMEGTQVIKETRRSFPSVTKQAVYQILRRLRKEEVVVVFKKEYVLSEVFVNKVIDFFEAAKRNLSKSDPLLNLLDGEYISYHFKNSYITDQFWAHAFIVLSQFCHKGMPVMLYNPHEWFYIARESSERSMFEILDKSGIPALVLVGTTDPLDIVAQKYFQHGLFQYYAKQMSNQKRNYYLNIFNDYFIEVWLNPHVSCAIDEWYRNTKVLNDQAKKELQSIIGREGKTKIRISRNKKRANRLRRLFKKDFFI